MPVVVRESMRVRRLGYVFGGIFGVADCHCPVWHDPPAAMIASRHRVPRVPHQRSAATPGSSPLYSPGWPLLIHRLLLPIGDRDGRGCFIFRIFFFGIALSSAEAVRFTFHSIPHPYPLTRHRASPSSNAS